MPRKPHPKSLRNKNLALFGALIALVVIVYIISVMRMRMGG